MKKKNKNKVVLLILALLLLVAAGVTVAYMFRHSDPVENVFIPARVFCKVEEDFNKETGVKSSVTVRNTGNVTEFLRVRLVSYWMDDEGNIMGVPSEMPTVSYDTSKWIKGSNDTYYCKAPVLKGELTPELLTASVQLKYPPEETYYQVLEIIPEAIQGNPKTAIQEAWGATVTNGAVSAVK